MEKDEVQTVERTGVYVLDDGTPVRLKKGDVLPPGAEFRDAGLGRDPSPRQREKARLTEATTTPAPVAAAGDEQRARGAAPENRARGAAAEHRAEGGTA